MDDWYCVFVQMDNTKKFKEVARFSSLNDAESYFQLQGSWASYIVHNNEILNYVGMGN